MISDIRPSSRALITALCLALALVLLAGCGGDSGDDVAATGRASFSMTDAPADDVTAVHLTVNRVALKQRGGVVTDIELDEPVVFDNLLALQGSASEELLPERTYPAGEYEWVRLYVVGGGNDSYVMTDLGGQVDLFVPGQQKTGSARFVQLSSGFVIPAGGEANFVIDVDLRKALTKPSGKDYYLLRPSLRISDQSGTGTISGTVDPALLDDEVCTNDLAEDEGNAVYLFSADSAGSGDVYVDQDGQAVDDTGPLSVALVSQNTLTGEYEYEFGFVSAGNYTLALTCQALDDLPDEDDELQFQQSATVTVEAESETEADFTL